MAKHTWTVVVVLSALALLGVGWLQMQEFQKRTEAIQADADVLRTELEQRSKDQNASVTELTRLRTRVTELEDEINQATRAKDDLEVQMRTELESREVTISQLQGGLTVDILDRVLFDSGEAELKPEGREILLSVAKVLSQFPERQVQVAGHTDDVPINVRTRGGFTDNWDLSAGRALAAVRFLQDHGQVDPTRLSAVACGEFRPIADNTTPAGRARNRRIAVVVLPPELVPLDVPSTEPPSGEKPTNDTPDALDAESQSQPEPESDPERN